MGCQAPYLPKRYVSVFLTSLGMVIIHAMRVNIAMTVVTILDEGKANDVPETAISLPPVDWDSKQIGLLHSVFYMGYLLSHLPGGYFSQTLSSQKIFGFGIFCSCSLNLLLPAAIAKFGYVPTCVIRFLQGVAEGVLYPGAYAIMRHWTTPEERSRMGAIVLTGVYIGPVIGLSIAGWLTHSYSWTYVYYLSGVSGITWFIIWMIFTHDTPLTHPNISSDEREFILSRQGQSAIIYEYDRVPWGNIIKSAPVLAIDVCNFARSFIFFFLLTNEPAFLSVFNYNLAENGLLSALPHALLALMAAVSGPLADLLILKVGFQRTVVRKLFTCFGFGVEALCMLLIGSVIQTGVPALVCLTVGVGVSGLTISGWQINHLDLAPRYASILVAISTAFGTIAGIINPLLVGLMTTQQTIENWQHVFLMTGAVLAFAAIFYGIFGSGDVQPWANQLPEVKLDVKGPFEKGAFYGTFPDDQLLNGKKSH